MLMGNRYAIPPSGQNVKKVADVDVMDSPTLQADCRALRHWSLSVRPLGHWRAPVSPSVLRPIHGVHHPELLRTCIDMYHSCGAGDLEFLLTIHLRIEPSQASFMG